MPPVEKPGDDEASVPVAPTERCQTQAPKKSRRENLQLGGNGFATGAEARSYGLTSAELSAESGLPYQSLINLYLRDCAEHRRKLTLKWAV